MKFIIFIFILSILNFSSSQTSSCYYGKYYVGNDEVYACGLTIDNPNGLELAEPTTSGGHQGDSTDDDVIGVLYISGTTSTVPSVLCSKFLNLQKFSLKFAGIKNITDDCVAGCYNLKWLQISFNQVSFISENSFRNNVNLTFLELNSDDIIDLPRNILDNLINLESLDLGLNRNIKDLSGYFKNLLNLKFLYLNEMGLEHIDPDWFATNTNLNTVYFYNNYIKAIETETLSSFTSLEYLSLFGNQITKFAENCFINLKNLQTLDLHANPFSDLKNGTFRGLVNLISIDLGVGEVHHIDADAFEDLGNLTHLELINNELEMLPVGVFRHLPKMQFLGLYWNHMKAMKRSYFGDDLTALTVVDLDENEVEALDEKFLDDAVNLRVLSLVENGKCGNGPLNDFQNRRDSYWRLLEGCVRRGELLVDTSTEPSSDYQYHRIGMSGINIQVYTDSELHIAVSPTNYTSNSLIEVFIGTSSNSKSLIKINQEKIVTIVTTPKILKHGELNEFMITWENHVISVHKDGEEFPFMAYTSAERFENGFYGIKSIDSKAFWSMEPDDF